jgi:hypothetical protein
LRIAVKEFTYQAHTEEAGCAGDENQFIAVHSETDLILGLEGRRTGSLGYPGDEKRY